MGVRELSSIGHLCRCEDMRPHVVHQAMNTHDHHVASAEAWLLVAVVDKDDMRHVSDAHEDRTPPLASSHRFLKVRARRKHDYRGHVYEAWVGQVHGWVGRGKKQQSPWAREKGTSGGGMGGGRVS